MLDNKPLVSIVIPAYNREKYISHAIECSINQTYKNIEIIIVDNQSTDQTWNIITDYSLKDRRIKCYQNEVNLGPVLNWNEGFKRASGKYLKILWSDDWMSLDFIEKALNCFDDDVAFVLSGQQITTGKEVIAEVSYKKRKYSRKKYLNDILLFGNKHFPVSPGCAIFRTKDVISSFVVDIDNNDSLDSKKNGAGNDLLLYLITILNYDYVATLPGIDSFFRYHQGSFTIANNLCLYYEWAKVYFINNNKTSSYLSNSLKAFFLFRFFRIGNDYKRLYESLSFKGFFIIEVISFYFCYVLGKICKHRKWKYQK